MEYLEKTKDCIYEPSILSFGKYEILFASALPEKPEELEHCGYDMGMQYINGALCDPNSHFKYEINWRVKGSKIASIDFKIPQDDAKLSTIFGNLPYGLIKKNRTGVGATTLELNSKRNSIIVVPTRALAYEKTKNSWNEETQKYTIHYIGGQINGFTPPSVSDYLRDNTIIHKKFVAVIDSLPNLLEKIGGEKVKNYFIMFDEIDSYQYDSYFRPNMETGFDYYFKFPETQRCLVSATVGDFTDPRINAEPVINLIFNNPAPRNISLKETNDVSITVKKHIESLLEAHPDDKILVAFNLLKRGILPIIKSLPTEYQSKCAVLCSEKNKADVGNLYWDVIEKRLPKQITFMTCTYFVGIDFEEPFHLISSADVRYPFTLLSSDKLQQIAGRCRIPNGLLSETIIYNTNASQLDIDIKSLSKQIVEEAKALKDYFYLQSKVMSAFPKLVHNYNIITKQELVENSNKKYDGSSSIKLIREASDSIHISYFNIDNILIQVGLLKTLYAYPDSLKDKLTLEGHNVTKASPIFENDHIAVQINEEIEETHRRNEVEEREHIITQLRESSSIDERERLAQRLRINCMNINSAFLEHFLELQGYVPFDKLVELLPAYNIPSKYNHFKKQILVWALDDNHSLKIAIRENFPIDGFFSGDQLTDKFNSLWHGALGFNNLSNRQAIPMLNLFCELSARTSTTINRDRINGYKILSYDPLHIDDTPIRRLPNNEPMIRHLR